MDEYSNAVFAQNLKIERIKRGWKQGDLAEKSGVGVNSIARYETGETTPGLDNAMRIARAFGTTIDALAGMSSEA